METRDESPSRRLDLWALALAFLSVAAQGHRFGVGNHEILIAQARRVLDSGYLAHDWSLNADAHHPLITHALGFGFHLIGEPLALLLAHLATRLLLLAGMQRLCRALVPGAPAAASIAAMALAVLEPRIPIGGHYLQGGQFEAAFLGMAAAVWTLAFGVRWIEGEAPWWKFGLAAGFAALVHLFIGLPAMAVVLLAGFAKRRGAIAREAVLCCAVAAVVGAPSLGPAALQQFASAERPLPDRLVIALLEARHPHHHMPWTWPATAWAELAAVLAACAAALARSRARMGVPCMLLGWYVATGALFWLCTWFMVAPTVVFFQAFRLTGLLLAVGACGIASLACSAAPARGWWGIALAVALVASFRVPPAFAVVATVVLLVTRKGVDPRPATDSGQLPLAPALGTLAIGLATVGALQFAEPLRAAANRMHFEHWLVEIPGGDADRALLASHIQKKTAADAILLVPPGSAGFRIGDRRAIVADMKFVPFTNAALAQWAERILLLTGRLAIDDAGRADRLADAIVAWRNGSAARALSEAELDGVAARCGASWIVTDDGRAPTSPTDVEVGRWRLREAVAP